MAIYDDTIVAESRVVHTYQFQRESYNAVTDNETALESTSVDFRFAATVAGFGMLLRHSDLTSGLKYPKLLTMAQNSRGTDEQGYRAEFIHLLEMSELLHDK